MKESIYKVNQFQQLTEIAGKSGNAKKKAAGITPGSLCSFKMNLVT